MQASLSETANPGPLGYGIEERLGSLNCSCLADLIYSLSLESLSCLVYLYIICFVANIACESLIIMC